jgi:hypothetical protein
MKIAIVDCVNQDLGLKILFPEADYYIHNDEECTINNRLKSYSYYNINVNKDWSNINDSNYDYLFAIIPIYDAFPEKVFYKSNIHKIYNNIINIINNNNFKKIFVFDNYDYDYDPSEYLVNEKITYFFKRNYNKNKTYKDNVIPFPFIMFGETSLIEKIDKELVSDSDYFKNKNNRIFFSGGLYVHNDPQYDVIRDRITIYNQIKQLLYNPGYIQYDSFLNEMRNSKFSLDLLGVGEPNKRTIEILLSGSLLLTQKHYLKWPFEEDFCEETKFTDANDFNTKINNLLNNNELYNNCLSKQYNIVKKYFNKQWLRNYILNFIGMKILLINYNNSMHIKNLNGLSKYNIQITQIYNTNIDSFNLSDFDVVYSPCIPIDVSKYPNIKFLFGPQFSIFPDNNHIQLINKNENKNVLYIQPSKWVVDLWKSFPYFNINIKSLPFGVDTDKFCQIKSIPDRKSVFIYFKRRNPFELEFLKNFLQKNNIDYRIFSYVNKYSEEEYLHFLQNSKYGIWLDAHESQGFALQEALSCNVPLLVWNVFSMNQEFGSSYQNIPATTIPYWNDDCGEYFYHQNEFLDKFNLFMSKLNTYNPRQFILNNLSIKECEKKFIDIINNI